MLESLLLVTGLRLERNCIHHSVYAGLWKIIIASMKLYLIMYITLYLFICMHLFAFISDFLKLVVYMLGYVPYITTGFTDFSQACNYSM